MEYLQAAVSLQSLIKEINETFLARKDQAVSRPNRMWIQQKSESIRKIEMESFSNDFVTATLDSLGESTAFVVSDLASMDVKGKQVHYFLYKAYHSKVEKGLVYYQMINLETLEPIGSLQFSNVENNIFYTVGYPEIEESSCNAMETDKVIEDGKSIVFFIGHMDEKRLAYDVERLIFDTLNNISHHEKLKFEFIVQIARYGKKPTESLKEAVAGIEAFTRAYLYPEYPNASFEFTFENSEENNSEEDNKGEHTKEKNDDGEHQGGKA